MGLDIHLRVDNAEELYELGYFDNNHSLSRTFCNFMCRRNVCTENPELDQIGKMTGIDISPFYDMEKDLDEGAIEYYLSTAENDSERESLAQQFQADKDALQGNIDLVLQTMDSLIQSLSQMDTLDQSLDDSGEDTLGYEHYFTDFNTDKGDGYIGNNFGQDLRNFKCFLDFAKSNGAKTVWFAYE